MLSSMNNLDAREKVPENLKKTYKFYQKVHAATLINSSEIIDFKRGLSSEQKQKLSQLHTIPHDRINAACRAFLKCDSFQPMLLDVPIFHHADLPGKTRY